MKRRLSIISCFYIILLSGCAIFEPSAHSDCPKEFDPEYCGPTDSGSTLIESSIKFASDDAEESASGAINKGGSSLSLGNFDGKQTITGLRFKVDVPNNVVINEAYIRFTANSSSNSSSNLELRGEAVDSSLTFDKATRNISTRKLTSASTTWSPVNWSKFNESTDSQKTPSLTDIVQEIVDRPGWKTGNYMSLIISGSGTRSAISYNNSPTSSAKLFISYSEVTLPPLPVEPDPIPIPPVEYIYQGKAYDLSVKPVYDQAYRDGFMSVDVDDDGLPDSWEISYGLDPKNATDASDKFIDPDQDGLTAKEEFLAATNPTDSDTDGDGMPDGYEVLYGLNPTNSADALLDLDGDGFTNLDEYLEGTDPTNKFVFPVVIAPTYTVEITWDVPNTREDGSVFTDKDVAAFIIHYGSQLDSLSSTLKIDDPTTRSTQIDLNGSGTYYFSVSVVDKNEVESNLSSTQPITVGQ